MDVAHAERRAKVLGAVLIGGMFAFALVVHEWPVHDRARLSSASITAGLTRLAGVPASRSPQELISSSRPVAMPAEGRSHAVRVRARSHAASAVAVPEPFAPLDTAPILRLAGLPDVRARDLPASTPPAATGNAMTHVGIAIGRAFRTAGVKTATAFTRIFE